MTHANNLHFPECMFAHLLLHTVEDNYGKQNQYEMKEMSIPRE